MGPSFVCHQLGVIVVLNLRSEYVNLRSKYIVSAKKCVKFDQKRYFKWI